MTPRFELPDWFSRHIPNWQQWLAPYMHKPGGVHALEIGSCEGRSALWLVDVVGADLVCIDPYVEEGFLEGAVTISAKRVLENFRHNVGTKATLVKERSSSALRRIHYGGFDIIYIDGSHKASDVLQDIVLSWPLLKPDGTLIMDDYFWSAPSGQKMDTPKPAIDAFLDIYDGQYRPLGAGVQVAVRKT